MKKALKFLVLITLLFSLSACGDKTPDLEDRVVKTDTTSYTGVIEPFGVDIYKDGTHQIQTEDGPIIIQSPTVNLNDYLGRTVTIKGYMQKLIDSKSEVFTVEEVVLEGDLEGEEIDYKSTSFGFQFTYSSVWKLSEEADGLVLESNGTEWVEIDVFNTNKTLDDFVASFEIEDGTVVTIGSQRSIRYVESREIRIYTPNASREKVYRITFNDAEEDSETHKGLFYDFLETFTALIRQSKIGEKCGGKENLTCPEDFRCELESDHVNAEGVCTPVDEDGTDLDCPFVPIPSNCANYETKNVNKDGCPTSYECTEPLIETADNTANLSTPEDGQAGDAVGTQDIASAEPALSADRPEGEAAVETAEEPVGVVATFTKYQETILPDGADVLQFELIEDEGLLAVIFMVDEQNFRTLYRYEPSANEYNFEKQAHYEEGEERDWVLVSGEDISSKSDKTIIKPGDNEASIQVIRQDMRLYENPHKNYSVQYPGNWYYRSFGSIENTVWSVGFAEKSLDDISDAEITLVILDGSSFGKSEMKGERYLKEVSRDDDSHFLLDGPLSMKEELDWMAESIIQN